ncbi:MAG: glycine/betaine ABC transporter substrate-binding protein [Actinomycetia bacterium]|nr:glycine/betaine ABC transporter substrate-binding protein [Actinomycetes bacterium]
MAKKQTRLIFLSTSLILTLILIFLVVSCSGQKVSIGSKPFNEQYILAHMIALLVEDQGIETEVQEGLGGTSINYEALKQDQIDAYVEYTGTAYSVILNLPQKETWDPQVVYQESEQGMIENDGIHIAANIGFQDNYGIAVPRDWAQDNNIETISELEAYSQDMAIGTDPEFATRPDGLPQLEKVYGITFGETAQMEPTLMYEAIRNGDVDAISGYTTDTRIDRFGLMFLIDDKNALIPYDAIVLVKEETLNQPEVMEAIEKLEGRIDTDTMRQLNYQYDVDQREARDIARDFLLEQGLIK